jgi:TatA/E family protein of Tat protein translocase
MQEILVILVLALIFLGPKKLPELASGIGKAIREVRKATADIKNEIQLDDAIRKPLEELREATMLPPEELKRRDEERRWREQREKEEAERIARGEVADPNATDPYDGHDPHAAEDYHRYDEDPNSHAPDHDEHETFSEEADLNANAGGKAPGAETQAADLTVKDLPPAGLAEVKPIAPSAGSTANPALAQTVAAPPMPTAPPAATVPRAPARPSPPPGGTPDDRTIAMPLPPPMEGSAIPSLPPPRPPSRPTPPLGAAGRAVPPPPPLEALKAPAGAAARPTGTLFGMPQVAPAPAPESNPDATIATAIPPRDATTSPHGVKLPAPANKKS